MPSSRRILVADEEEGFRKMLSELFESLDYSVDVASDGKQAVQMCASHEYDLAVIGFNSARTAAEKTLSDIKDAHPNTPVIAITDHGSTNKAAEAIKLGAYDCISKPFNADEAQAAAHRALERSRLIEENNSLRNQLHEANGAHPPEQVKGKACRLRPLRDVEKHYVREVLEACDWNQSKAAAILQIDRKTLRNKVREFGLKV